MERRDGWPGRHRGLRKVFVGDAAWHIAMQAECLGFVQGRSIVRLRGRPDIGVFDPETKELVLLEAPALLEIAMMDLIASRHGDVLT